MINERQIIPSIFFIFFLCANFSYSKNSGTDYTCSIKAGGLKRTFLLHIPPRYDSSRSVPLLIVLHGGGGDGQSMVKLTKGRFNEISDNEGFIVVYPDGYNKHWNDGRTREEQGKQANKSTADDAGFISALIDRLVFKLSIDPKRIYVTGMSNGAIMSYRLACELSEKIAAIAPLAGNIPQSILSGCFPTHPVSVLAINNVNDPLVPFTGGEVTGPFGHRKLGKVLSAAESVRFWVTYDTCSTVPVITSEPDRDPQDGTRIRKEDYMNHKNNTEVVLYIIEGGGHTWPGGYQYFGERTIGKTSRDMNAADVIWDFFEKHSRE